MELEKSCGLRTEMGLQDRILSALYGSAFGRMILRPLVSPWFSALGGKLLDTKLSALAVKPFVRANGIDLTGCEKHSFQSYNDFFKRKLDPSMRPVAAEGFVSPCDARLSVYPITSDGVFEVKHTSYTVRDLLKNRSLAEKFEGGYLWLYRLCVDDYHRYIYPETGRKSENIRIAGIFHTVNPIANDCYPIYKENTREYCLISSAQRGTVLMMEVGAMLVGKIENRDMGPLDLVRRGEEKGNFAFGGSTIIVMTRKGAVQPEEVFLRNTEEHLETKVKLGQRVGS